MHYSESTHSRSVFNKILDGEIPWVILCVSERFFAILTNMEATRWHTLLIPKRCGVQYPDFTQDEFIEFSLLKQVLMQALLATYAKPEVPLKIGEIASGFEIKNHYHLHLIPATSGADISLQHVTPVSLEDRIVAWINIKKSLRDLQSSSSVAFTIPDNQ